MYKTIDFMFVALNNSWHKTIRDAFDQVLLNFATSNRA